MVGPSPFPRPRGNFVHLFADTVVMGATGGRGRGRHGGDTARGSASPNQKRAGGAALRYEHSRQRPASSARPEKERMSRREVALAWLCILTFVGGLVGLVISAQTWGPTIWGDVAPDWPGGGYGFAG